MRKCLWNMACLAALGVSCIAGSGCDDLRLTPIVTQVDKFAQDGEAVTEDFVQDGQSMVDAFEQTGFTQVDAFQQKAAAEVDILWVVDNSASMGEEQDNLAANFQSFIQYIDESQIDYHIGVIAMDMYDPAHSGKLVGTTKVISRETPSAQTVFAANIRVGDTGGGYEQGLLAAHDALSEPLLSGANAGFLRDTASLAVIFVSDEDDHSAGQILYFTRFFSILKDAGNERRVIVAAIVGDEPDGCDNGATGAAAYGERYHLLVDGLGGSTASICAEDFSLTLSQLGLTVAGLGRKFLLSQEPDPTTLVVRVRERGEVSWDIIPRSDTDGWRYDPSENAIYFDGSYVPPPEADLEVEYGNSQYEFPLTGRGDPGTLVVTVDPDGDGPLPPVVQVEGVDFEYDAANGAIVFYEGHVPPLGSVVEASYASLRREFHLSNTVENPETLVVMVDLDPDQPPGYQEVLRDPASGYIFDAGSNSVLFQGSVIPPLAALIQVSYSNLRYLFPLTKQPLVDTLEVELDPDGDGPATPAAVLADDPAGAPGYVYYDASQPTPYTNAISFEKLDWPPLGSVVKVTYQPASAGP